MKAYVSGALIAVAVFSAGLNIQFAEAKEKWLITPTEMGQVSQKATTLKQPVAIIEGPGPSIILENPKMLESVRSPLDIFISFQPGKSGKPPDMATLKVRVVGFIDIDITDRVIKYIKQSNLDIIEAELPTGEHELGVFIKDIEGNSNERIISVTVVP